MSPCRPRLGASSPAAPVHQGSLGWGPSAPHLGSASSPPTAGRSRRRCPGNALTPESWPGPGTASAARAAPSRSGHLARRASSPPARAPPSPPRSAPEPNPGATRSPGPAAGGGAPRSSAPAGRLLLFLLFSFYFHKHLAKWTSATPLPAAPGLPPTMSGRESGGRAHSPTPGTRWGEPCTPPPSRPPRPQHDAGVSAEPGRTTGAARRGPEETGDRAAAAPGPAPAAAALHPAPAPPSPTSVTARTTASPPAAQRAPGLRACGAGGRASSPSPGAPLRGGGRAPRHPPPAGRAGPQRRAGRPARPSRPCLLMPGRGAGSPGKLRPAAEARRR